MQRHFSNPEVLAVQENLCQKLLFLHQLSHNMTIDCSLVIKIGSSEYLQNMLFCFDIQNNFGKQQLLQVLQASEKDWLVVAKLQKAEIRLLPFSDPQIPGVLWHSSTPDIYAAAFMTMRHQQYLPFSWTTLNGKNCLLPIATMEFGHTLEKYNIEASWIHIACFFFFSWEEGNLIIDIFSSTYILL